MLAKQQPSDIAFVPLVSVDNMMRLINSIGTSKFIRGLAEYIEAGFKRWSEFDKTPRASHSREGVIDLMPTANAENYGFKYVNGHPKNQREGYQTVTAFGVLSSVSNGYPILIAEMTVLAALRTTATSALVGSYLAPKNAEVMAMIGYGAQCEFQAITFRELFGINKLRLFDVDPDAAEKARRNLVERVSKSRRLKTVRTQPNGLRTSPPAQLTSNMPRSLPTTWLALEFTSTQSAATAQVKPNCTVIF